MQPFRHAIASARQDGRSWESDLPIHEFMDMAKHACPDLRHRLLLHNSDLGPELAARAFPERSDARQIALDHVRQDLGWTPDLKDWLERCDQSRLPFVRRWEDCGDEVVAMAVEHLKLEDDAPVRSVWDLLTLPARVAPEHARMSLALLMNGFGPILARTIFGPPQSHARWDGGATIVDFGWICEGMIVASTRRIFPLGRILDCFDGIERERKK
jgi:hypothetical protein